VPDSNSTAPINLATVAIAAAATDEAGIVELGVNQASFTDHYTLKK
jgi:hypothetical protein